MSANKESNNGLNKVAEHAVPVAHNILASLLWEYRGAIISALTTIVCTYWAAIKEKQVSLAYVVVCIGIFICVVFFFVAYIKQLKNKQEKILGHSLEIAKGFANVVGIVTDDIVNSSAKKKSNAELLASEQICFQEEAILRSFMETPFNTTDSIMNRTGLVIMEAEYYTQKLIDKELLEKVVNALNMNGYRITQKGREYVMSKGIRQK